MDFKHAANIKHNKLFVKTEMKVHQLAFALNCEFLSFYYSSS